MRLHWRNLFEHWAFWQLSSEGWGPKSTGIPSGLELYVRCTCCHRLLSSCVRPAVWEALYPWCLPSFWLLQVFLLLYSEVRALMETSHLRLSSKVCHSAHCPAVGLCICSPLLQDEGFQMIAEGDTDLSPGQVCGSWDPR